MTTSNGICSNKAWSRKRHVCHVKANGNKPLLVQHTGDGTPGRARFRVHRKLDDHFKVVRNTLVQREFYCHRLILQRWSALMTPIIYTLAGEPVPCVRHTTWILFNLLDSFAPLLRELGFCGLALSIYIFDGAQFHGLYRRARQRHQSFHNGIEDIRRRERSRHMDNRLGILFALHKVQTAQFRACKVHLPDVKKGL